jgi:hypothetical protein
MGPSLGAHDAMMPWYLPGLVNIHTLRTGKKTLNIFSMGKSLQMAIFNSYVTLPEGNPDLSTPNRFGAVYEVCKIWRRHRLQHLC